MNFKMLYLQKTKMDSKCLMVSDGTLWECTPDRRFTRGYSRRVPMLNIPASATAAVERWIKIHKGI